MFTRVIDDERVSMDTVETDIRELCCKLGAASQADAVVRAHGLGPPELGESPG